MTKVGRIGPNPYVAQLARHVPRVGLWSGLMVVFFGWPMIAPATNKAGIWSP